MPLLSFVAIMSLGAAVQQAASARQWRQLERTRAASGIVAIRDLQAQLAKAQERYTSEHSRVIELADDQAQAGDRREELTVLVQKASTLESDLRRCAMDLSSTSACLSTQLSTATLLKNLQALGSS
jgi:uncharacterized membrane protein